MGRKYSRYVATSNGSFFEDPDWAFEVIGNSIVTYKTRRGGLFWRKKIYEQSARSELKPNMEVRVWARDGSLGNVEVKNNSFIRDYHILVGVDEFADEVRFAISQLK